MKEEETHSNITTFIQPEKEGRGDDKYSTIRWFALQLFDNVYSYIVRQSYRLGITDSELAKTPFSKRHKQLQQERDEITNAWQDGRRYSYDGKGSIFADYKYMSQRRMDAVAPGEERQMQRYYKTALRLPDTLNIDADELFERCLAEVAQWWL